MLEEQQYGDIDACFARLSSYGLREFTDFDKYTALSMADALSSKATQQTHPKASFITAAAQPAVYTFRSRSRYSRRTFLLFFPIKITPRFWIVSPKSTKFFAPEPPQPRPRFNTDLVPPQPSRPRRVVCYDCVPLAIPLPDVSGATNLLPYSRSVSPYRRPSSSRWPSEMTTFHIVVV